MNRRIIAILFATIFFSCSERPEPTNRFADSVYVSIGKLRDERNTKGLLTYLKATDPSHLAYAALAFGSVQDSSAVDVLGKLLDGDHDVATRRAAAFALGQTRCTRSEKVLLHAAGKEEDSSVLAEIVEGYGKVARHWNLSITPPDTIVSAGLAWGIYRAGLTGIGDSLLNKKAVELLRSPSRLTRMGAAYYFARSAKEFHRYKKVIEEIASNDVSEDVRMAAALAVRKLTGNDALQDIIKIALKDPSYRVQVNAVRALGAFPISKSMASLLQAVRSENVNVAIQASETLLNHDTINLWEALLPIARGAQNWRVQANLYQACMKGSQSIDVEKEIIARYKLSSNPYQKGALLNALGASLSSFRFVRDELFSSTDHAIKTAAAAAIVSMNSDKHFNNVLKATFADTYAKGISTADLGLVSIFGTALADPSFGYRSIMKDTSFLYVTRKKLKLPADNEALQALGTVIAYFEGKPVIKPVNRFNHPIDWRAVADIPSQQRATIRTAKGNIEIRLLIDEAPGSVVNFVSLAKSKYFDGKNFHRVVPNFVAQGGCNRGDGYGGEDYSIRSEFSQRRYTTGSIGMASAGKDTEGTQWFITHSPTPHLDGQYTIFAVVESGMDVVHKLEVGDNIIGIAFSE